MVAWQGFLAGPTCLPHQGFLLLLGSRAHQCLPGDGHRRDLGRGLEQGYGGGPIVVGPQGDGGQMLSLGSVCLAPPFPQGVEKHKT